MKTGKAPGHSEVSLELIAVSERIGIQRLAKYVRDLGEFGIPDE